jgi:hypothetical protein
MSRSGRSHLVVGIWISSSLIALVVGLLLGMGWDKVSLATLGVGAKKSPLKATAWLRVRAVEPLVFPKESAKTDPTEFESYKRNLVAMMKGAVVVNRALDDKTVQELPVVRQHGPKFTDWLSEQIEIEFPGNGELMSVSVTTGNKEQARSLANAIVSAFMKEVVEKERTDRLIRRDNLEKKLRTYKQQVLDKRRQLYELSQQVGAADAPAAKIRYRMEIDMLEALLRTRTDQQKQISDLSFKIEMAKLPGKNAADNKVPDQEVEAAISKDPQLQEAMADLANLLHDQHEIEKVVKDKATDPAAARIRDAIRTQRRTIDDLKKAARLQVVEQLKSQSKASEATAQSLELERQLLSARLRQTIAQIETQAETIQKLERFNGDVEELRAEIEQNQAVVKEMADSLTRWTIELDAPPRVTVLEPAG